ncbi:MAG TPA: glycoside hydrolase family 75 protein [Chthoniobacterales bacterium]|nr:glycoside hydrolase family 75 protein [Chthoniobacterales bacterium]
MRKFRLRTLRFVASLLLAAVLAAIVLRWISLEQWHRKQLAPQTPIEIEVPEKSPTPAPSPRTPVITGKLDTARLFSGITVQASVEPTPGGAASEERADPQSYVLELKLRTRMPAPNSTIEDLAKVNPDLPRVLPGLATMVTPESVSPFFKDLYDTKLRNLKENLVRLDQLLSRHNFYDCQTVLQLRHPETKRRAVLLQADMDVDADGSDSDRLPSGSGTSANFQAMTSYRWPKKTDIPNFYLGAAEEKLKRYENELAAKGTSAERKKDLKSGIASVRDEIATLKKFSFLIGATDPYIVLPIGLGKADGGKVGDYALVIFGDRIFPALVGDVGPSDKAGEASLRIAKEISGTATPYNRPVSDLKVTYLVFPGTAETPFGPPDLEKIHAKCEALVKEIGGSGVPLHHWENIIPPLPSPTPTPTPSPTPTASPSGSPATPGATPASTFAFPIASPSLTPSVTPIASPKRM